MRFGIEFYWTEEHGGTFAANGKSFETQNEAESAAVEYNVIAVQNRLPMRARVYSV